MANLPIMERLRHYFLAMGAQPADTTSVAENRLVFTSGLDSIQVVVLSIGDALEGGRVVDSVLNLASLRESSQLLYLAAPRLLGTTIDAATFRLHGIGLLFYDERRIDEAVHPQPVQPVSIRSPTPASMSSVAPEELATLKSMYVEMQRTVANIREEIRVLHHESESRPRTEDVDRPTRAFPSNPVIATPSIPSSELPSFFANNPWLEVLSRRGRSESAPIAG